MATAMSRMDDDGDGGQRRRRRRRCPGWITTAMSDGYGDADDADGQRRRWRTATATAMTRMDDDVVVGDGNSVTDGGDGNSDGAMDNDGRQRRQRLAVNTTINLPLDMKVVMYWLSSAPPSMRARQGSLIEILLPKAFSIFSFLMCGSL